MENSSYIRDGRRRVGELRNGKMAARSGGGGARGATGEESRKEELDDGADTRRKSTFVPAATLARLTKGSEKEPPRKTKTDKKTREKDYLYLKVAPKWSEFLHGMRKKEMEALVEEYRTIANPDRRLFPVPADKARYCDISCWDETRVLLNTWSKNGFIHANFVDGLTQQRQYILTQGPTERTVSDFWELVWQERSCLIVMLCCLVEGGREKTSQYWPSEIQTPLLVGAGLKITLTDTEGGFFGSTQETYIRNYLSLSLDGEERKISQIQYGAWPDRGTPEAVGAIMDLSREIQKMWSKTEAKKEQDQALAPIVVHCSAGIGRSGTFVAIDLVRASLSLRSKVDILPIVKRLREQRWGAVQRPIQYLYIYASFLYYLRSHKLGGKIDVEDFHARSKQYCLTPGANALKDKD